MLKKKLTVVAPTETSKKKKKLLVAEPKMKHIEYGGGKLFGHYLLFEDAFE